MSCTVVLRGFVVPSGSSQSVPPSYTCSRVSSGPCWLRRYTPRTLTCHQQFAGSEGCGRPQHTVHMTAVHTTHHCSPRKRVTPMRSTGSTPTHSTQHSGEKAPEFLAQLDLVDGTDSPAPTPLSVPTSTLAICTLLPWQTSYCQ